LGVMIRWALREGVAHATPPADGWERISDRVGGRSGSARAEWWRGFRVACTSVALWLLESTLGPPVELVFCDSPELGRMREEFQLSLLMYQNDLPMLLSQTV
jgi:hypothetical protein